MSRFKTSENNFLSFFSLDYSEVEDYKEKAHSNF